MSHSSDRLVEAATAAIYSQEIKCSHDLVNTQCAECDAIAAVVAIKPLLVEEICEILTAESGHARRAGNIDGSLAILTAVHVMRGKMLPGWNK